MVEVHVENLKWLNVLAAELLILSEAGKKPPADLVLKIHTVTTDLCSGWNEMIQHANALR